MPRQIDKSYFIPLYMRKSNKLNCGNSKGYIIYKLDYKKGKESIQWRFKSQFGFIGKITNGKNILL